MTSRDKEQKKINGSSRLKTELSTFEKCYLYADKVNKNY